MQKPISFEALLRIKEQIAIKIDHEFTIDTYHLTDPTVKCGYYFYERRKTNQKKVLLIFCVGLACMLHFTWHYDFNWRYLQRTCTRKFGMDISLK